MRSKARLGGIALTLALLGITLGGCNDNSTGGVIPGPGSNVAVTVGGGTTPQYSWNTGQAFSLSVVRTADPTTIVWGLVTPGQDGINSAVTHGTVQAGTTATALPGSEENPLTPGVEYRVSVTMLDQSFGFTEFTP